MTDPLKILKHEHRIMERVLRALGGLCAEPESLEQAAAELKAQWAICAGARRGHPV